MLSAINSLYTDSEGNIWLACETRSGAGNQFVVLLNVHVTFDPKTCTFKGHEGHLSAGQYKPELALSKSVSSTAVFFTSQ